MHLADEAHLPLQQPQQKPQRLSSGILTVSDYTERVELSTVLYACPPTCSVRSVLSDRSSLAITGLTANASISNVV